MVAAIAMLGTAPVGAFQAVETPLVESADKPLPDGTTPEERANTARLNAAQASQARSENITYEQEVSAAEQTEAAEQARFAEETAVYEDEKARIAALSAEERMRFEADVAAWKADVAACEAGDQSRCAKPRPVIPR